MRQFDHTHDECTISVFYMDAGDKIPRHRHPHTHSTTCIRGRIEVEIWYVDQPHFLCEMEDSMEIGMSLPADIDHEIRALENNTIVINLRRSPVRRAPTGGIVFDNEVRYD